MQSAQFWLGFAVVFSVLLLWGRAALALGELSIRRRRGADPKERVRSLPEEPERKCLPEAA